jgi:hypothetical protein
VVRQVFVPAFGTEVPDKEAHGIVAARHLGIRPDPTRGGRQHVAIGVGRIGIRYHDVGGNLPAIGEPNANRPAAFQQNFLDIGIAKDLAALVFEQPGQRGHDRTGAAHRGVNAILAFQRGNEAIDLGDRKRVTPNQQGMKTKDLLQLLALKVPHGHAVDRLPGLHAHHRRHGSQKIAEAPKARSAQFFVAEFETDHGLTHKGVIARNLLRAAHTGDLRAHGGRRAKVIKVAAVMETNAVEGCHRPQIDII